MKWNPQVAKDISSQAHQAFLLSAGTKSVIIDSDSLIYIRFDTASTDTISATADPRWVAGDLRDIPVPDELGGNVYLHVKQVSSALTKTCRVIEL